MFRRESFESIMSAIKGGLSGNSKKDAAYLMKMCEKYKKHKYAKEIARECGRLLYERLPNEKKEELNNAFKEDFDEFSTSLEKVRFCIFQNKREEALSIIEGIVKKVESLNMFQSDEVSEYFLFNEPMEEVLYAQYHKTDKTLRRPSIPYTEIYFAYGSLLMDLNRYEDARTVLVKCLKWNPMSFQIFTEYTETFKIAGDVDAFLGKTIESFKLAIHASDLARCFRNLGYYFVEKNCYPEAVAAYNLSINYEGNSKQAQSELYYIASKANRMIEPEFNSLKRYSEKLGFPMGPDPLIVNVAYEYGRYLVDAKRVEDSVYFFSILYELTKDERVKKLLDDIENSMK